MPEGLRWPEAGDVLFDPKRAGARDSQNNACLGWARGEWYPYVEGYHRAALALHEHLAQRPSDLDTIVLPLVFLWRQYIELHLKYIILLGSCLTPSGPKLKDHEHHRIAKLWPVARTYIEEHAQPERAEVKEAVVGMSELLGQLADVDPESFTFRYPLGKMKSGGGIMLPDWLTHLNVRLLRESMERVRYFLECTESVLAQHLEYAAELRQQEAEMQAEYDAQMRSDYSHDEY